MQLLTIDHLTVYRYRRPVRFGEHRLMVRPRDSHDLRVVDSRLTIVPTPRMRWIHDVFGNSIALAEFDAEADELRLQSRIVVEHYAGDVLDFPIEEYARSLPFAYPPDEVSDLGPTMGRQYPDPEHRVDAWVRRFLSDSGRTETQALLLALTAAVRDELSYTWRTEPGVQTPGETLAKGSGSCRDFALLMMEAARSLGLAARFVTGYLHDETTAGGLPALQGTGATHAWLDVYLPGAGWVEFDPTNGIAGGSNLIRVAVARDPSQAVPIRGSFTGAPDDFLEMTVEVNVDPGNRLET